MDRKKLGEESIALHANGGKLEIRSKAPVNSKYDLSIAYTPGVADVSMLVAKDPSKAFTHTIKKNMIAVVSDGSAVLGLGNIGPLGALPVMEGKAVLLKEFGNVDAFPLCVTTQDADEIITLCKQISPVFGGINLEDISAPRCFTIEAALQDLGIPVFHDDQHGTAVVVFAGIINALKVVGKKFSDITIVISGAGAAGIAVCKLLLQGDPDSGIAPVKDVLLVDSKGIIHTGRTDLNFAKKEIAQRTNKKRLTGTVADALKGADVFIGVSAPGIVTKEMIASMAKNAIVFAMANPVPEILPDLALEAGATVVGTGRSDFPNQINNVLAFPGIFRGALDAKATRINHAMKVAAALALASCVPSPTADKVIPEPFEPGIGAKVAAAVAAKAIETGDVRKQ